ncbi:MAG: tRNA pseudouridine(38-40) synthase TruA [Actinomycetota bacterium]
MTNLRLLVAYDGSKFAGFQVQPDQRTVQGVLENALRGLTRDEELRIRGAGRTDAGVHALGQVVTVDAPDLDAEMVMRAMPSLLPHDVSVLDVQPALGDFDARRSARSRIYVYLLWCCDAPHPLYRNYSLWIRDPVDVRLLDQALRKIIGTHDFTSFARLRPEQSPFRTIFDAGAVSDSPFVRIRLSGNAFLHQQVRSIVGTALEIAAGRKDIDFMRRALDARNRSVAGPVAAPEGLTLTDVSYDAVSWPRRPQVGWPWSDLSVSSESRWSA